MVFFFLTDDLKQNQRYQEYKVNKINEIQILLCNSLIYELWPDFCNLLIKFNKANGLCYNCFSDCVPFIPSAKPGLQADVATRVSQPLCEIPLQKWALALHVGMLRSPEKAAETVPTSIWDHPIDIFKSEYFENSLLPPKSFLWSQMVKDDHSPHNYWKSKFDVSKYNGS